MSEIKFIQTTPQELDKMIRSAVRDEIRNTPKEREKPYTKKEVAEIFKVKSITLDRWNKNGTLKSYKAGRLVYYKAENVHALMDSKR